MKTILVVCPPEDRAQRALGLASRLARKEGARIILLRVLEATASMLGEQAEHPERQRVRDLIHRAEAEDLNAIAAAGMAEQMDGVEVCVEWGVPWEVILDLVASRSVDLVVKPAWGVSHEGRVFFGTTALHLFRRCPCPVWVVGDDGRLPERIVAAIDPSAGSNRRNVAGRILRWAQKVGEWSAPAEVHVASAWHALGSDALARSLGADELARYREDARTRAQTNLDEILSAAAVRPCADRVHLIEGPPRDALPRFAEQGDFDLIVLGTLGRGGVVGDLLGETAEMILRAVRSSVLTISPWSPNT